MLHEVFISYSHRNLGLADRVKEVIDALGYSVYLDRECMRAGEDWKTQLIAAIQQGQIPPVVVLLATSEAVDKPDVIRDVELAEAIRQQLLIIPLEFDIGAADQLLGNSMRHVVRMHAMKAGTFDSSVVERELRKSLNGHVKRKLDVWRAEADQWRAARQPYPSFWTSEWREFFPGIKAGPEQLSSVVLLAPGGSGKSVLISHLLEHLLLNPGCYPVVIAPELLKDAVHQLPPLLGSRSDIEFPDQIEALRRIHHQQVVWIIDGLDQFSVPNDPRQSQLAAAINMLIASAPTIVSCRPEVWDAIYVQQLSIPSLTIPELDDQRVRQLFQAASHRPLQRVVPLLRIPFFLRIAIEKAPQWPDVPETEMTFLGRFWQDVVANDTQTVGVPLPTPSQKNVVLMALAQLQLTHLAYETPLRLLREACTAVTDLAADLNALKAAGMVIEIPIGTAHPEPTIRLRHDLFDCYGMVRSLMASPTRDTEVSRLFDNLDRDCTWTVLATLARFLHENGMQQEKRAMFEKMLYILDRKPFQSPWMPMSWKVTYILRSSMEVLQDLILEAISGDLIDPLPDIAAKEGSRLGAPARITQVAGSTLASAFLALDRGSIEDADQVIPVMEHALKTWRMRGRLIDALGRYPVPRSLDLIVGVADAELGLSIDQRDAEILEFIAQNLQRFDDDRAVECLQRIRQAPELSPRIHRLATISLHFLRPGMDILVPELTNDELIENLKPVDRRNDPSDWKRVQEAAVAARVVILREGGAQPELLTALVQALDHKHSYVRCPVSDTLGWLNEPEATYALLRELLEPDAYEEVRHAGTTALRRQLLRANSPLARQRLRFLMLMGARVAQQIGRTSNAAALVHAALEPNLQDPEPWIFDEQTLQVAPQPPSGLDLSLSIRSVTPQIPIDPQIDALLRSSKLDVGPNLEPKYRVAEWHSEGARLHVVHEATTWTEARQFHQLMLNPESVVLRPDGTWLEPLPLGVARLPGLSVVHAIVLTSDNYLILAQRSPRVSYAPRHWSASFEEQITGEDFDQDLSPALKAAARGFQEEFGLPVPAESLRPLTALLELNLCNLGFVVLLRAPWTAQQIQDRWQEEPRPTHWYEAVALQAVHVDRNQPDQLVDSVERTVAPLHPTSHFRLKVLVRAIKAGCID